uniref:Uracil phosphoribosyltransferase n=1 Tax=Bostrychia simpliciuscula TaxID=324754 RepID=A0A1Z1M8E5_9FLOR|nr:uracil phosphoribosyltransferase [Bostrychia simpliciuscula]ARW62182.1 uracil phosphoribosyltransferase [Bostrychia simpliciuscula]
MQLNIYKISHPIIQFLSSSIINKTTSKSLHEQHYKYIGLLFIYEVLRKYIKTEELYIKNIHYTKNVNLINLQNRCYIFTDLPSTYRMITDIKILLPNIEIVHVEYKNDHTIDKEIKNINKNIELKYFNINIFILDEIIKNEEIIKLIKYLKRHTKVPSENMHIACIACYNEILNKLSNIYPKLKVYTTKIIYNNK